MALAVHPPSAAEGVIYVNGRFLTQQLGGVQRFCREVVKAIDSSLQDGSSALSRRRWVLLGPADLACDLDLKRMEVRSVGPLKGHAWEQLVLGRVAGDGVLVNLANSGPVMHPRSVTVIHDVIVYRMPGNFSFAYKLFHQLLGRALARRSRIGTVSAFSRSELHEVLGVDLASVFLVPNACDHVARVAPDDNVLARLDVRPGKYFLQVGTPAPNKNIERAMAAFARLGDPEQKLVLVGSADRSVFSPVLLGTSSQMVLAGRLSDAELVALYRNSTALVFPSLYEGFGIPPLEAMAHGCPVLASRIPSVQEVCGEAALYFDPLVEESMVSAMREMISAPARARALTESGFARVANFSWKRSAASLLDVVACL